MNCELCAQPHATRYGWSLNNLSGELEVPDIVVCLCDDCALDCERSGLAELRVISE